MENEADVLDTISNTGSYDYPIVESEDENDINQKEVVIDTFSSPYMFEASKDRTRKSSRNSTPSTRRKLRTKGDEQTEEIVSKEIMKIEDNLILPVDAINDTDVNEDLNVDEFDTQMESCVEDNNLPDEQMLSKGKAKI